MENNYFDVLNLSSKNFIFVGESGSGKSEVSIHWAAQLSESKTHQVHFFDLDQSKPLFRSRDDCELLESLGIHVHSAKQFLDSPIIAPGVAECLQNSEHKVVLDAGGGIGGAKALAQFSDIFNRKDSLCIFVFNCYRPWGSDAAELRNSICALKNALRANSIAVVCNPYFGKETSRQEILDGVCRSVELLSEEYSPLCFAVGQELISADLLRQNIPILPLRLQRKSLF